MKLWSKSCACRILRSARMHVRVHENFLWLIAAFNWASAEMCVWIARRMVLCNAPISMPSRCDETQAPDSPCRNSFHHQFSWSVQSPISFPEGSRGWSTSKTCQKLKNYLSYRTAMFIGSAFLTTVHWCHPRHQWCDSSSISTRRFSYLPWFIKCLFFKNPAVLYNPFPSAKMSAHIHALFAMRSANVTKCLAKIS